MKIEDKIDYQPFHLAIPTNNLQKSREFYGQILGCP